MIYSLEQTRQQWRAAALAVGRNPLDDYDPKINQQVGTGWSVGWPACQCSRPKCPYRPEPT
ncbi:MULTISPECIES: hypothetical protein [Kitasatospora]|uniref:hypothetical protein n=1 Tax=Kitasatospora TaxID=2063 RepID=UPI0005257AFC|nr:MULTISPECIES: hypothetical protein [Kitasatospora]